MKQITITLIKKSFQLLRWEDHDLTAVTPVVSGSHRAYTLSLSIHTIRNSMVLNKIIVGTFPYLRFNNVEQRFLALIFAVQALLRRNITKY